LLTSLTSIGISV